MSYSQFVAPIEALGSCLLSGAPSSCLQTTLQPTVAAAAAIAVGLGVLCYVLSWLTGNDSWVDRSWSIVPPGFLWFYVWHQDDSIITTAPNGTTVPTALGGFAMIGTVWGIRLTYNFWRRGGYQKGGEDYRWEHVRTWPMFQSRLVWHIFSLTFISLFQQWLLWAITLPVLSRPANAAASPLDLGIMTGFLFFITLETFADEQQWRFQNEKRQNRPRRAYLAADYQRGFLTHGLFALSRHPNVWSEQQIWLTLYSLSILRYGLLNWSGLGVLALIILTIRSCALTEQLSTAKYPSYRAYQRAVSMLVPSVFSRRGVIDREMEKLVTKSK